MMKRLIVVSILLALMIVSFQTPVRAQTGTPPAPPTGSWKGAVTGRVVNKTSGESVPNSVDLILHGWDPEGNEKLMLHGKSDVDGTYRFTDVDFQSGIQVLVMSSYKDAAYYSDAVEIQPGETSLELTVPIYETTSDLAAASIEAMHVLFYMEEQELTVTEVYVLGNRGDRTVKDVVELPRERKGTLKFPLPEGAKNVTFDNQSTDRFVLQPDGFTDTAPLPPGSRSSQVVVKYSLSYTDRQDFQFQLPVPVDTVSLLVPEESGLSIQGKNILSQGAQEMQGTNFTIYSGQSLKASEQLNLTLSGKPKSSMAGRTDQTANQSPLKVSNSSLAYGAGAFGLALVMMGIVWWRRSESNEDEEELDEEENLNEEEEYNDEDGLNNEESQDTK